MDFDDFLFIVRARRAVRTATAKGDALARGWSWRVAWGCAVDDETAFHGRVCGMKDDPEKTRERERERTRPEVRQKGYGEEERRECSVIFVVSCFIYSSLSATLIGGISLGGILSSIVPLTRLTALCERTTARPRRLLTTALTNSYTCQLIIHNRGPEANSANERRKKKSNLYVKQCEWNSRRDPDRKHTLCCKAIAKEKRRA